ncbi:hypothetical protein QFC20_002590 [Naganishia adeliensis]|uniref:Uncharacterized protein n=1 Tax=Naganishia adeliensis TaxID=92952 RepID=A0ACC2WJE9_9TREE|nr:hypothetical protein QFC20_002590 [Naganishia adeliensis]
MKFLDIPSLSKLSEALAYSSAECKVNARLEAYSCKEIKKERKLRKNLEEIWVSEVEELDDPFGSLDDKHARQTHWLLVSTLNLAYPDHDFSAVRADQFQREPGGVQGVLGALSGVMNLGSNANGSSPRSYGSYPSTLQSPPLLAFSLGNTSALSSTSPPLASMTHPTLLRVLGEVISLDECVVYSYVPSAEADPHQEDIYDESATDDEASSIQRLVKDDDDTMSDIDEDDTAVAGGMMLDFDEDDVDFGGAKGAGHTPRSDTEEKEGNIATSRRMSQSAGRHRGGLLWSVNYFFYCKRQRRILFMSVWARNRSTSYISSSFLTSGLQTNPFSQVNKHHHAHHGMPSLMGLASSISSTTTLQTPSLPTSSLPDRKHKHLTSPVVQAASARRQRSESVASKTSAVDVSTHAVKRVRV